MFSGCDCQHARNLKVLGIPYPLYTTSLVLQAVLTAGIHSMNNTNGLVTVIVNPAVNGSPHIMLLGNTDLNAW